MGVIVPLLEDSFRIKHRDIRVFYDFIDTQQKIYIDAAISMAVWEAVYIVFAILPAVLRLIMNTKAKKVKADRKGGHENGQDTDKRLDGNGAA